MHAFPRDALPQMHEVKEKGAVVTAFFVLKGSHIGLNTGRWKHVCEYGGTIPPSWSVLCELEAHFKAMQFICCQGDKGDRRPYTRGDRRPYTRSQAILVKWLKSSLMKWDNEPSQRLKLDFRRHGPSMGGKWNTKIQYVRRTVVHRYVLNHFFGGGGFA